VTASRPLALREPTSWTLERSGASAWATFADNRGQFLRKATEDEPTVLSGNVWREPLPLELAAEEEPIAALLGAALRAAGVRGSYSAAPLALRVLEAPSAALVVAVNESATELAREATVFGRPVEVRVLPGRCRLLLLDRATGALLAEYPEPEGSMGSEARPRYLVRQGP
jgi:hypothetical protein